MKRPPPKKEASSVLAYCADEVARKLNKIYGSAEEAEKAVSEAIEDLQGIEEWATETQRRRQADERAVAREANKPFVFVPGVDLRNDEVWSFDRIPQPLRDAAVGSMAGAMLVARWEPPWKGGRHLREVK